MGEHRSILAQHFSFPLRMLVRAQTVVKIHSYVEDLRVFRAYTISHVLLLLIAACILGCTFYDHDVVNLTSRGRSTVYISLQWSHDVKDLEYTTIFGFNKWMVVTTVGQM